MCYMLPCRSRIGAAARAKGKSPLDCEKVKEAEVIRKAYGCRFTSPGIVDFGFQPQLRDIPKAGVKVSKFSEVQSTIINDVAQAMVPDEMHVFKGVWDWSLHVSKHNSLV